MVDESYDIKAVSAHADSGVVEYVEKELSLRITAKINQRHAEMYQEALQRYPDDAAIDEESEKKLKRKLDRRILPLLGICYFFYVCVSDHTESRSSTDSEV